MANVKITELTNLTDPSTADVMPVVDVDADVTKKVSVGEVVGKITGDVDVATNGTSSIAAGVIVNADVNANAEIAVSKLANGAARQLLQTAANGVDVEWTDDVDLPGTLGVTGVATLDDALNVAGLASLDGGIDVDGAFTVANTSGNVATSGTLGVTGQSTLASAAISDLTEDRVVIAGASGKLEDSAKLTFNGSELGITGTLDVSSNATVGGDLTVVGGLTVEGTTTTLETQTVTVEDKNIELGVVDTPSDAIADGGGLTLKGSTDKTINWVDATDAWTFSEHIELASGKEFYIDGNSVLNASTLGSGVTTSSLTSVGTIGTGVWQGTTVATGYGGTGQTSYTDGELLIGTTAGSLAKATLTAGSGIDVTNDDGSITVAIDSSVVTTSDTGTVTSTMILDGTIVNGDINDSAAIADTKLATISTAGKVSNSATTATDANTASAIVARDASGNFSAGTITAALTGNADTATALETARDIGGVSFDGTANINLPGVNTAGDQDTSGNAATATKLNSSRTFAVTGDVTGTVNSDLTSGASIATSIALGVIVDADVNDSAAIAGTKIDPDFGSQTIETTGVFSAAGGAEATPSIAFTSDLDTGVYSPAEKSVAISTRGAQRLLINSDGDISIDSGGVFYDATNNRLGVGITFPRQVFHAHASSDDARLRLTDDTTGNGAFDGFEVTSQGSLVQREATGIKFFVNNGSSTDECARIDSSGRVLVGLSTLASGGDASAEAARFVVQGRVGNDNDSGRMNIQRGSVPPSAGIDIGSIYFTDSSNNIYASILAECDGTTGAGDYPGRLAFSVTADGASSPTEALGISNDRSIAVSDGGNVVFGTTTGTKIGTATSQKIGFYNATPVVQPNAVADITTTATSGSLPTPDGSVTIADATTPTVTELLEYCVELEAKLEAGLGRLRALGLIAS